MTHAETQQPQSKVYRGLWKVLVERLRVPQHPPEIPGRLDGSGRQFQPARGFLRYLKFWFWVVWTIIDAGLLACWVVLWFVEPWVAGALTPIVLLLLVVPPVVFYIAVHLRFDTTWYVMTDRALRIRRGIWIIEEKTITYENIQNVTVTQGPVQRSFNIANVKVETAGVASVVGKQKTPIGNYGLIEGVTDAAEIRSRILAKMRASTSAGLGDELQGDSSPPRRTGGWSPAHIDVLRQIRSELAAIGA